MIEEEAVRRARLQAIREADVNPYPARTERTHAVDAFLQAFETLESEKTPVTLAGRIKTLRKHGGLTFMQVFDGSGTTQLALRKDNVGEDLYTFFHQTMDMGDFIEATGTAFVTKKGEQTLDIQRYKLLTKTILPMPEKWHGLTDTETRFRKRYLDLLMNESVRHTMRTRSRIISAIRSLLDSKDFIEVETPTLQPVYGGGFARPFVTHHHALHADFYLRISDEMYLKRLLVGGFERVYEMTKVFRNEGIDRDHNPEFTMFEAQIAYKDYQWGMDIFEEIFEHAAKAAVGSTSIAHGDIQIEIARPWARMRLIDAVESVGGLPADTWNDLSQAKTALKKRLKKEKHEDLDRIQTTGEAMALAFEELVEEQLIQPTLIYDYPVEVSPLAKRCEQDPRFVERFEAFALGMEIGNNYSELNDPVDLEKRFIEEKAKEEAGFDEAHQTDTDYLEAIKHGMPPACGLGIGIDRMAMLLTGTQNIKEVILFPTLKPVDESES